MPPLAPEFDRYLVRLRMTAPARFHFLHGGAIRGLLSAVLERHRLPEGLIPFPAESGRSRFEPGDAYHLGLTLAGDARGLLPEIETGLRRVGRTPAPRDRPLPKLGGNFDPVAIEPLPAPDGGARVDSLRGARSLTLRFRTPLILSLKRDGRPAPFGPGFFPLPEFLDRLWRRTFRLVHGHWATDAERRALAPPLPAEATADPAHLEWLELPVDGNRSHGRGHRLRGAAGRVEAFGVPDDWLPTLVDGQYLHAGASTAYGFGAYALQSATAASVAGFRPSRTALDRVADPAALHQAFEHIRADSKAAGVDRVTPDDFRLDLDRHVADLARDLATGAYEPRPLLGFLSPKPAGGFRPLAIPTVRDRVAQRAASQVLAPALDTILEDCSYGYRKGLSRAGAARAIQKAYADGFRYVLDADISAFFDSVDWGLLFDKLDAHFPDEPLVPLLQVWVRQPVEFDGRRIERDRGLPQGSAVAPLLANLFLDEFDEQIGRDYRLVRYADDFVVLCRSLETAHRARADARRALADLGLDLSAEKTAIRSLEEGFSYLGYLFCRSLALEQSTSKRAAEPAREPVLGPIPSTSWLATVPLERLRELALGHGRRRRGVEVVPLAGETHDAAPRRQPVYVTSHTTSLRLENRTLVAEDPGGEETTVPVHLVSHLVIVGRSRATVPLLLSLAHEGVPSFFCRRSGELTAAFEPRAPDWQVWTAQAAVAADGTRRAAFARELVAARLHNLAALAIRFRLDGAARLADELRDLRRESANKTSLDILRGVEGRGAALWFIALAKSLDPTWGFHDREKRPPPDPVNAMLSFGYTLLHHHLSTALTVAGLNPRIGLYHRQHGAHHALASDLIEEFRFLVEAQVLSMIHREEVEPADFRAASGAWKGCRLTDDFRKRFIAAFERRLLTEFTPPDGGPTTYRAWMARQSKRLRDLVLGRRATYPALRTRS